MLKYLFIGGGTIALFAGASQATKGLYTHLYQVPGIVLRLSGYRPQYGGQVCCPRMQAARCRVDA
jgi:hypothetical protein